LVISVSRLLVSSPSHSSPSAQERLRLSPRLVIAGTSVLSLADTVILWVPNILLMAMRFLSSQSSHLIWHTAMVALASLEMNLEKP
jgi:hypothetical protein